MRKTLRVISDSTPHAMRGHDLGRVPARRMRRYAVHAAGFDLAAPSNSADRAVDTGAER